MVVGEGGESGLKYDRRGDGPKSEEHHQGSPQDGGHTRLQRIATGSIASGC